MNNNKNILKNDAFIKKEINRFLNNAKKNELDDDICSCGFDDWEYAFQKSQYMLFQIFLEKNGIACGNIRDKDEYDNKEERFRKDLKDNKIFRLLSMKYRDMCYPNLEELMKNLDKHIKRIKKIKWFKYSSSIDDKKVEECVKKIIQGFGIKIKNIEYKKFNCMEDFEKIAKYKDADWNIARETASILIQKSLEKLDFNNIRENYHKECVKLIDVDMPCSIGQALCIKIEEAEKDVINSIDELLIKEGEYKQKYIKGSFINLISLWEMGLYPIGKVEGNFRIGISNNKNIEGSWDK